MAHELRIDFQTEIVRIDDATHNFEAKMIPDPRRYTRIEKDGIRYLLDKYLRHLIPEDLILSDQGAQQLKGLPIYHLSSSIDSASEYAAGRKIALNDELQGGSYKQPAEAALQHQSIAIGTDPKDLAFLSIDICGGSMLRRADRGSFERAYEIFIRELGTTVGQFHARIYKPTGDGFIAYLDHPAFTSRSDQAVDLGLSLLLVLRDSINPALLETGLPELHVRIGADTGAATLRNIEVPTTGYSDTEIASDALNRAVKIQESAGRSEFRIGRDLYELVHVQWLERAHEVPFDGSVVGVPGYKVYRVT